MLYNLGSLYNTFSYNIYSGYNYFCNLSNSGIRYLKTFMVIWFIYPIFSGFLYQLGIGFKIDIKGNILFIPIDYKFKIGYIKHKINDSTDK